MDKEKLASLEQFFSKLNFTSPILLGPGETISDLPRFLESHFTNLKANCPAVLQEPYLNRLLKLQMLLSEGQKKD